MTDFELAVKDLLESEYDINSIAIIESTSKIVYSTKNWDIREDLKSIVTNWNSEDATYITISGLKYRFIQNYSFRIVASSLNRKFSIIGLRDDERIILCQTSISSEDNPSIKLIQTIDIMRLLTNVMRSLSSKAPYMDLSSNLGKVDHIEEISTKFLFDTTKILQRLGLQKFGLSSDEVKVYLTLLKKNDKGSTVGKLNKELDIKRTTIYRIIERLLRKNWVEKAAETPKGTQIYTAKPIMDLVNKIIEEKDKEIKILKSFRLLISEYMNKDWGHASQIYRDSQSFGKEVFDIDVLGIMGLEKDFGIIIFEYIDIEVDELRVRDKLDLVYSQIKDQLEKLQKDNKIPDYKDLKIEYNSIQQYFSADIYLKFKEGSKTAKNLGDNWIIAIKEMAIPIENNIYVIWGSEEKFQTLLDMILMLS